MKTLFLFLHLAYRKILLERSFWKGYVDGMAMLMEGLYSTTIHCEMLWDISEDGGAWGWVG